MAKCRSTRLIAMPMPRAFQEAYAAHQRGALAQAESAYQAVLAQQPHHPDCLHLLGVLRYQQGRHNDAAELIRRALAAQPELAGAWLNLGNVLKALGDTRAALDAYGQALALQPEFGAAHVNRANTLQALGRHAEAVAAYRQALTCEPHNAAILNNLGNALASAGDLPQAAAAFEAALEQAPTHAGALNNLGNTRKAMGETEQALAHFRAALALQPDFASAWFNLGHTLDALDRCAEAAPAFEQALALQPEWLQARYGLAHALAGMGQAAQARAHYEQVLRHDPGLAAAWQEMGCALYDMGEYDAAAHAFERALQARPDFALASFNRALIKLLQGDLRGGWPGYEARWLVHASAAGTTAIEQPRWSGATPLVGRTLLVHAEQGLGDTIQFVRYIPSLAKRAAHVILEVQPELSALLTPLAQSWGVQLIAQGQARPPFDCHCPLLSLPLAFNTTLASIPNPHPYLAPREADTLRWRTSVAALRHPRIGIVWSGRVKARGEHRALPLARLETLLARNDIDWVLLQKDTPESDRAAFERIAQLPNVHAPAYALENFADTAALIGALDGVLSIDTSVAHLAAALGKPTWIMLPYAPDWRWLLERTDSPWYAQVRLFRQGAPDAWDEVLTQVAHALDTLPPSWRHG